MERLLQYIWQYRLFTSADLMTADGVAVTVIDPGIRNTDAGPDFHNAKVKIGGTIWAGNVEIHCKASEWKNHHHDRDTLYDSVILHVVEEDDYVVHRSNGEVIPQVKMRIPDAIRRNMDWLLLRQTSLPCAERIREVDHLHIANWMTSMLTERLERKVTDILALLEQNKDDWNEVFYIILTRSFGFGSNSDAFEYLAKSLPFKYIRKQRGNSLQIEALLFGQAGLLEESRDDPYYQALQQEYRFLQQKYGLTPVKYGAIKQLRMRPINFPHLRLAQLAAIWTHTDTLFSRILEDRQPETLRSCFDVELPEYWDTHYHFSFPSPAKKKTIGRSATNSILINAVAPTLFAYGKKQQKPDFCDKAIELLEQIPPERNSLVTLFTDAGVKVGNACDTQALIQLRREYCEKKKCLYCRIGFYLIKGGVSR
ncbi:MAG: DUF2851 family protein [Tannerella sp.]|jgi:hypothetical protein|nr:DUF2851 family protein [Tannerella sp.]